MKPDIMEILYHVEVSEMPHFPCSVCNETLEVSVGHAPDRNLPNYNCNSKRLIGIATCRKCKAGTGFELTDNVISYVSGNSSYGQLSKELTDDIKMLYSEAELCFQHGSPNASAAMCRASIELALDKAGFHDKDLYHKIEDAGEKDKLDQIEVGLAHTSRLITRNAIHRHDFVSLADIPSMLSATIRILNKLSPLISSSN